MNRKLLLADENRANVAAAAAHAVDNDADWHVITKPDVHVQQKPKHQGSKSKVKKKEK